MVNPLLIIAAAVFVGVIFIRKEIGETGTALGVFGTGLGTGLGNVGRGIQTFVSSILSPQIRPALVPTLGLQLELPSFGGGGNGEESLDCVKCGGADYRGRHPEFCLACVHNRPSAPDDRQGGRNVNVQTLTGGRLGIPPMEVIGGRRLTDRAGARPEGSDLREAQMRGGGIRFL